jgi:hypothetical protein
VASKWFDVCIIWVDAMQKAIFGLSLGQVAMILGVEPEIPGRVAKGGGGEGAVRWWAVILVSPLRKEGSYE